MKDNPKLFTVGINDVTATCRCGRIGVVKVKIVQRDIDTDFGRASERIDKLFRFDGWSYWPDGKMRCPKCGQVKENTK